MKSRLLCVSVLALIVGSASCSGEGKPGQDDSANTPQLEAEEAAPETETLAPDPATEQTGQTEQNPTNQRPTDVTLIMGNSLRYTGTYHASQLSQTCGELSPEESITGERVFIVEFPYDGTPEITAVSFGSSKLVSGITGTDQFRLNVGVKAKQGGEPPIFAMDTVPPVQRNMGQGTATLNDSDGTATLRVVGANEMGETIDITLVCKPRQD
jgi:hypothetical protein